MQDVKLAGNASSNSTGKLASGQQKMMPLSLRVRLTRHLWSAVSRVNVLPSVNAYIASPAVNLMRPLPTGRRILDPVRNTTPRLS